MPNEIDAIIGVNVSRERQAAGLTVWTLAEAVGLTGQQLLRSETGERGLGAVEMCEVCRALDIPISKLLNGV